MKVVALNPSLPRSYQRLAEIYRRRREGREFVERFLSSNLDYLRVGEQKEVSEVTGYHYRKLHKALSSRGIRHLAMQYPIKPLRELEDQLKGAEGVVFLGNEKNFASALELGRYDEYFIDRFATVFGHTTEKGSRLIAENASAAVRKIVAAAKN